MDARKHLIIIKGKDQTDSVASFQFHDGKCEVVYTSAPNKSYSFQRSNVEILPLQKKIDPARVIVTANGQAISGIDEILDFGGYYRIVRNGKRDLSFRRSEVQFQQNCLTDGKNQEYYASYSDVPMESLDKLSSQKLLALWMEFEQHAEHETRLGLLQKLSIMFRFNRNALKLFLHSPELVIPYLQSQVLQLRLMRRGRRPRLPS